ncbi:MAG: cyanophycinase [Acidobacteriota bacterium]
MRLRALTAGWLLVGLVASPVQPSSSASDPRTPTLVLVGGALARENDAVYETILDARLPGRPLCVLPTASGEPDASMASYLEDFRARGGADAAIGLRVTRDDAARAADPDVVRTLAACGGFFFTGGDQSRIVDVFRPGGVDTPALEAIRSVLAAGGVVAGTSAGAAMPSDPMIGAGSSADALRHGVVCDDPDQEGPPGVWLRDGLGLLPGLLVDQHFLARGRLGRLLVAAVASDQVGLGIDENTALVITDPGTPRARGRVLGPAFVVVLEPPRGEPSSRRGDAIDLWLLADGDSITLAPEAAPTFTRASTAAKHTAGLELLAASVPDGFRLVPPDALSPDTRSPDTRSLDERSLDERPDDESYTLMPLRPETAPWLDSSPTLPCLESRSRSLRDHDIRDDDR